jgi:predicted Rossmann-fold nucleotide-binding protein
MRMVQPCIMQPVSSSAADVAIVAVLGPSNIARVAAAAGIAPARLIDAAEQVGDMIARRGWAMIVVPDRGVAVSAMDGYLAAGGTRLIGLTPVSGISEPAAMPSIELQRVRCHELRDELTWYEQHHQIGEMSDAMVTIGLSCGTIAELAWTKWNPSPPPVSFVEGTASGLPPEIAAELQVDVVPLSGVGGWLDASVAVSAGSVV